MSRKAGELFYQIADIDNIRLAFWKASRGKEQRPEVKEFVTRLDENLMKISTGLLSQNIEIGNYFYFTIYDPKERVICAASFPERILHHAIMNVCHPVFEKFQMFHSYATRPGKGQYAAIEQAKKYHLQYRWFCKLDVRKYFDHIDHQTLKTRLGSKFKDKQLLSLFYKIIDSYEIMPHKGIPIGNLTSQYFANFYLGFSDHYLKEVLHAKAYVRYMDDMVIWENNKEKLLRQVDIFSEYLNQELKLTLKPVCIHKVEKGLPFLGYVLFKEIVRLNKHSKIRFTNKLKIYYKNEMDGFWTQQNFACHIIPLIAFTQHAHTKFLRHRLLCNLETG